MFEAAGDSSSCRVGFANVLLMYYNVLLECLSHLFQRKTGIRGGVMQRGVGRGSGCASQPVQGEEGQEEEQRQGGLLPTQEAQGCGL